MKIIIGMTRSDTTASGSFKHICQVGERFRQEGAEVIYVIGGDGAVSDQLEEKGFTVYRLRSLTRNISPVLDLWSFLQLLFFLVKQKPDVCSWHTAKIGILGRIASALVGCRTYYVPHGVPFVNTPENKGYKTYERIERVFSRLPSKIIGVCQFDKNEYLRIGVSSSRVMVIPNGMLGYDGLTEKEVREQSVVRFITAARFEAQKDYETLASAVKWLVDRKLDFSLDIYGDGSQSALVKGLFSHLPNGVVNFKGVVNNFAEKVVQADVFILSSHWEGLPRSIIEAMACSKAVIASNVGGSSELIIPGESGFLIPYKDVEAMGFAMEHYIENPESIIEHGRCAYEFYQKNYSLDKMLSTYVAEYLPKTTVAEPV